MPSPRVARRRGLRHTEDRFVKLPSKVTPWPKAAPPIPKGSQMVAGASTPVDHRNSRPKPERPPKGGRRFGIRLENLELNATKEVP